MAKTQAKRNKAAGPDHELAKEVMKVHGAMYNALPADAKTRYDKKAGLMSQKAKEDLVEDIALEEAQLALYQERLAEDRRMLGVRHRFDDFRLDAHDVARLESILNSRLCSAQSVKEWLDSVFQPPLPPPASFQGNIGGIAARSPCAQVSNNRPSQEHVLQQAAHQHDSIWNIIGRRCTMAVVPHCVKIPIGGLVCGGRDQPHPSTSGVRVGCRRNGEIA